MHKITVIAVVAIAAIIGHTVTGSERTRPAGTGQGLMPSPFQMMSDAKDLPATSFVAP